MATIGLDKPYYAKITDGANGDETYGTPQPMAKAITANLSVELSEAILYADDGQDEVAKEFKSGKLTLGLNDIGTAVAADLTGATVDENGALVDAAEDVAPYVAVGFRARKANGKYRYFWLYRVKFGAPSVDLETKKDSISFKTPTIEGTILRRNKADGAGKHPWKAEITEGETGVDSSAVSGWFSEVYEPDYTTSGGGSGGGGSGGSEQT